MPRRRYDDDDYEDDRPRGKSGASIGLILGIVFGVLFLVAGLAVGYYFFAKSLSKPPAPAPAPVVTSTPTTPVAPVTPPVEKIDQVCSLSGLKRVDKNTTTPKIEVSYLFNDDADKFARYVLIIKTDRGKTTSKYAFGSPVKLGSSETLTLEAEFNGQTLRNGKMEVWVERTVGTKTERVSNIAYLLF